MAQQGMTLASFRWVVEEGKVREFREALRLAGADYISDDRVPIAYSVTASLWDRSHQELLQSLGLDVSRVVHGQQTFDVLSPLEIGVEYRVSQILEDVRVKVGKRGGQMLMVCVETCIHDTEGRLCVRESHTSIELEGE